MTGKISDLTAASRLRTGSLLELQDTDTAEGSWSISADNANGVNFDPPRSQGYAGGQIVGFTPGNTMEIETNTLAARLSLNPDEINYPGWTVSRQMWASSNFSYISIPANSATPGNAILEFAWVNVSGIAVIKKVYANLGIGAQASGVAGTAYMRMFRTFGLTNAFLDTTNAVFPPSMGGNSVGGRSPASAMTGMKANQAPAQARINAGVNRATTTRGGGNSAENAYIDASPIGNVEAGITAAAGQTVFRQAVLFDHMVAQQPLILVPGTGFEVWWLIPTTSNPSGSITAMPFLNLQWDEWTLTNPGATNG